MSDSGGGGFGGATIASLPADGGPIRPRAQLFAEHRHTLLPRRALDARAVRRRHTARVFLEPVVDVPRLDAFASGGGKGGLAAQNADGFVERFSGGHEHRPETRMFAVYSKKACAASAGKMSCMETLGELVTAWREASGLSVAEFARRVGVKYQNIQQLEGGSAKQPRYLPALAKSMGTTVDNLLALKMPPPLREGDPPSAAPEAPDFVPRSPKTLMQQVSYGNQRRTLTEQDFELLDDLYELLPEDQVRWREDLHAQADFVRRVRQWRPGQAAPAAPGSNVTTIGTERQSPPKTGKVTPAVTEAQKARAARRQASKRTKGTT